MVFLCNVDIRIVRSYDVEMSVKNKRSGFQY